MKDRDCGRRVHHGFGPTLCLMMTLTLILEVGTLFAADNRGERYEKGYRALQALNADGAGKVIEGLRDIAPEMSDFLIEFAYGDVFTRPALDPKSREMATIAALTALGNAAPQLKWHIAAALNIGVRPEQIIEIMYVSVVYHGFPAALNGIAAARCQHECKNYPLYELKIYPPELKRG